MVVKVPESATARSFGALLCVQFLFILFLSGVDGQRTFPAGLNLYCHQKSCYDVLELAEDADKNAIKKAYRRLSLINHPDKSNRPDADVVFMEIANAYEVLSNDDKRRAYDDFLAHPERHIWEHYGAYYNAVYAPKSDLRLVVGGIILAISAIQHMSHRTKRNQYRNAVLNDPRTKGKLERRVFELAGNRVLDLKKEKDRELQKQYQKEAVEELMKSYVINDFSLSHEDDFGILECLAGDIFCAPLDVLKWGFFNLRWIILFWILRQPYGEAEKQYRTRTLLKMTEGQWGDLDEERRQELTDRELWLPENWDVFKREKQEEEMELRRERMQSNKAKQYRRYMKKAA